MSFAASAVAVALSAFALSAIAAEGVGRYCPANGHCTDPTDAQPSFMRQLAAQSDARFTGGSSLLAVSQETPQSVPSWQSPGRPSRFAVDPTVQDPAPFSAPSGKTILLVALGSALLLLLGAMYRMLRLPTKAVSQTALSEITARTAESGSEAPQTASPAESGTTDAVIVERHIPSATASWSGLVALCEGDPVRAGTIIAGECAVDRSLDAGSPLALERAISRLLRQRPEATT